MSKETPLKLLKVKDAAEVLSISVSKMNSLYYDGEIDYVRVGKRSVRFKLSELECYVEKQTGRCGAPR